MNYYESRFPFDPKAYAEGTKQSAIEALLQRIETRSRNGLTVLLKEDEIHKTPTWWGFGKEKETHTARIIIASPDDAVIKHLPARLPVCNRQKLTVERLTDKLYDNLVPIKPEGRLFIQANHAILGDPKTTFFYFASKLDDYITEKTLPITQYYDIPLFGPAQERETIVNGKPTKITIRDNLGIFMHGYHNTFSIVINGPLDILIPIRNTFLKYATRIGAFDAIDDYEFEIFNIDTHQLKPTS